MKYKKSGKFLKKFTSCLVIFIMVLSNFPASMFISSGVMVMAETSGSTTISGTVTEAGGNNIKIPGAKVTLNNGTTDIATAWADGDGNYSFSNIGDGEYSVIVSGVAGYATNSQSITISGEATFDRDISIEKSAVDITVNPVDNSWKANKDISFHVNSNDLKEIYWSTTDYATSGTNIELNGTGDYQFNVTANGTYFIYAVNNSAWITDKQSVTVSNIETVKPTADITFSAINGSLVNGWYTGDVNVHFEANDTESEIKQVSYKIGTQSTVAVDVNAADWTKDVSWTTEQGANMAVTITVTDNAGNSYTTSKSVSIDKQDPTVPTMSSSWSGSGWSNSNIVFKIYGSSSTSNVVKYQYRILDSDKSTVVQGWTDVTQKSSISVIIPDQVTINREGTRYVEFVAISGSGRKSISTSVDTAETRIDKTIGSNPVVTIDGNEIHNGEWYTSNEETVKISIEQETDRSTNSFEYLLDGGNWTTGIASIDISGQGTHNMSVRAKDEAGNIGSSTNYTIKLDATAPNIAASDIQFSDSNDNLLSKIGNFVSFGYLFNHDVKVTIKANDPGTAASGVKYISWYTASNSDGSGVLPYHGDNVDASSGQINFTLPVNFEGYVFATAKDNAGNTMFAPAISDNALMIENTKPVITITPSPKTGSFNGTWYNGEVNVDLDISDAKSGINEIQYKIGSQEQQTINGSSTSIENSWKSTIPWVEENGNNLTITVSVKDNAGNTETQLKTVNIDKVIPEAPTVATGYINNTWTKDDVVYTITGIPTVSGINRYQYKVLDTDGNLVTNWTDVTGGSAELKDQVTISREGKSNVQFRVISNANNISPSTPVDTYITLIDKSKPTQATVTVDDSKANDNKWYCDDSKTVQLDIAQESDRSANSIWYSLDGGNWTEGTSVLVENEAVHILLVETRDAVGNTSGQATYKINIDETRPVITSSDITFKTTSNSLLSRVGNFLTFGYFFNEDVKVTIDASDLGAVSSGVKYISWYTASNSDGSGTLPYHGDNVDASSGQINFKLPISFKGYVFATAEDNAGNTMSAPAVSDNALMIENDKPIITIKTTPKTGGFNGTWYNGEVNVDLDISDVDSGINEIQYKIGSQAQQTINGSSTSIQKSWQSTIPWVEDDEDNLTITVSVKDNAGNIETQSKTVNIDKVIPKAPTINTNYINNTWTKDDVVYTINGTPTVSGINKYQYKVLDTAGNLVTNWTDVTEGSGALKNQVTIQREGKNNIQFRTVSNAENIGKETALGDYIALIDKGEPAHAEVTVNDKWYSASSKTVAFAITQEPDRSPNSTWYSLDEGSWTKASSVVINGEIEHVLLVKTRDDAGNVSGQSSYKVKLDNTKPVISDISFKNPSNSVLSKIGNFLTFGYFFNDKVTVTIKATDPGAVPSGVNCISYYTAENNDGSGPHENVTNNVGTSSGTITFTLPVGFKGYVFATAEDNAGNIMTSPAVSAYGLMIENDKPIITINTTPKTGGFNGTWYNGKVNVSLNIQDEKSGIKEIRYKVGSQAQQTVTLTNESTTKITTSWNKIIEWAKDDGSNLAVDVTVVDNAGNTQTSKKTVNIDKIIPKAPTITTSYTNNTWVDGNVVYTINGEDIPSGISKYQYKVLGKDGKVVSDWTDVTEGNDTIKNQVTIQREGTNNVIFRTVSISENYGTPTPTGAYIALIDKDNPSNAAVTIDGIQADSSKWYSADSKTVMLNISQEEDRAANSTWYKLDDGIWKQGTSVEVSGDNIHTLAVQTKDLAGNVSSKAIYKVRLDETRPVLNKDNIVIAKKRVSAFDRVMNFITFGQFFNETVSVNITASDKTSGIANITYYVTGEDKKTKVISDRTVTNYSADKSTQVVTFDLEPNFKGYVFATTKDITGNELETATQSVGVIVADKNDSSVAPAIEILPRTQPNANGFYKNDVKVDLVVTDAYSGINNIKYTIGSHAQEVYIASNSADSDLQKEWRKEITIPAASNNNNNVQIIVEAEDNSGNVTTKTIPIKIDVTSPKLDVKYDKNNPTNNKYYKENRTGTISIDEFNFNPVDVNITIKKNGVVQSNMKPSPNAWKRSGITNSVDIRYDSDGDYTFDVSYTDMAGNAGNSIPTQNFVIDKTLPTIAVSYDNNSANNNNYFKAVRTAQIRITEVNFKASDVKVSITAENNGGSAQVPGITGWVDGPDDTHTASINFSGDANYTFNIAYSDLASNTAAPFVTQTFVVDKTVPTLSIAGVKDLSANKDVVTPTITYSDTNIDLSKLQVTIKGSNSGVVTVTGQKSDGANGGTYKLDALKTDDNYVLTAVVYDKSGNLTQQSVSFSVNKNGATYEFENNDIIASGYVNKAFKPSIKIYDVDETRIVSLTLNGKSVENYTFENGVITINDEIKNDDKYVIGLSVRDAAGNITTMKDIEFIYDSTKPKNIITGVDDNKIYFNTLNVNITPEKLSDNIKTIKLNGTDLSESDYTRNDDGTITLTLTKFMDYTLQFQTVDLAGNISDMTEMKFQITNNIFLRIYETKPLFYGLIGCFLIAILGAGYFLIFFRKKPEALDK